MVDDLRTRPADTLDSWFGASGAGTGMPAPVRLLKRIFITGPEARAVRHAARFFIGGQNPG
jgi:hypothetical protein